MANYLPLPMQTIYSQMRDLATSPIFDVTINNSNKTRVVKTFPNKKVDQTSEWEKLVKGHTTFVTDPKNQTRTGPNFSKIHYTPRLTKEDHPFSAILDFNQPPTSLSTTTSDQHNNSWMSDNGNPQLSERPIVIPNTSFQKFCPICAQNHPRENFLVTKSEDNQRKITPPFTMLCETFQNAQNKIHTTMNINFTDTESTETKNFHSDSITNNHRTKILISRIQREFTNSAWELPSKPQTYYNSTVDLEWLTDTPKHYQNATYQSKSATASPQKPESPSSGVELHPPTTSGKEAPW